MTFFILIYLFNSKSQVIKADKSSKEAVEQVVYGPGIFFRSPSAYVNGLNCTGYSISDIFDSPYLDAHGFYIRRGTCFLKSYGDVYIFDRISYDYPPRSYIVSTKRHHKFVFGSGKFALAPLNQDNDYIHLVEFPGLTPINLQLKCHNANCTEAENIITRSTEYPNDAYAEIICEQKKSLYPYTLFLDKNTETQLFTSTGSWVEIKWERNMILVIVVSAIVCFFICVMAISACACRKNWDRVLDKIEIKLHEQ